jgi:hypothetical protein
MGNMGEVVETISARGHPRIKAEHPTTLMITKDGVVGPRGDCIVAVAADKGARDLSEAIKKAIRAGRRVRVTLKVGGIAEVINGLGHRALTLDHPTDLVIRKSKFTCGRTLAIGADKAAGDLSRTFVAGLRDPDAEVQIYVEVL